jgi:hypothetical protein
MNDEPIIFTLLCLALAITASTFFFMKLSHQTCAPIQTCVFVWHIIDLSCAYTWLGKLSQLAISGPSLSLLLSSTFFLKNSLGLISKHVTATNSLPAMPAPLLQYPL